MWSKRVGSYFVVAGDVVYYELVTIVVCWITKNWIVTALLWSSSSLLLRFETGYPGETENSKISLSAHHYFAFRACDHTFSGTFTFTRTSMFTSRNTNFTHSIPRRA